MKIERVNENKIKVRITDNDLQARNIDINSLNYNSLAAQELFWDMIEQAEAELGFETSGAQIVIEAMPESDGGYAVIITKLEEDDDFETIHNYIKDKLSTKKNVKIKKKRHDSKVFTTAFLYSFYSFDDVCELCKAISDDYKGDSALYKYKETYYLMITLNKFETSSITEFTLNEYGNKVHNVMLYEGLLNEYGTKIIDKNAIEIISSYF